LRDFLATFEAALTAADVACLLIDAPLDAGDEAVGEIARPVNDLAQSRGVATLLPARAPLAQRLRVDGVHLDLRSLDESAALRTYRDVRKTLGPDAIVGALCAPERHMAMEIAELDADYVGFADDADLIAWWAEMMNIPCIAFGVSGPDEARALAASGADFIAPSAAIWSQADPASGIALLGNALR
jgi:thiamine-phosphate pyrophosphorylase